MGRFVETNLNTAIGDVRVISWGDTLVIDSDPVQNVRINGVGYSLRLEVHRLRDSEDIGYWQTGHLYLCRNGSFKVSDSTPAARNRAKEVLLAAILTYTDAHPEFVNTGNLQRLEAEIADKRTDIARAEIVVTKLRTELDRLLQEFATSIKQPLFTDWHAAEGSNHEE